MRTPRLTKKALEGLARAFSHLEADDTTDDTDEQAAELQAAGDWIAKAWRLNPQWETEPGSTRKDA